MEAAATPGRSRRSLQTKDPCGRGRHSSRPRPRRSLPFLPLPASWAAPPSSEERSLLRESSPALSPLSLSLQQVWAPGRQTGAGRPSPGFLGSAPLPLGVRAFCCFYLGSGATRPPLPEQPPGESSPPPKPPPSLSRCLGSGSACENDVRIGGSKFLLCLGGPPCFFLGNQIILVVLIS